MANRTATVIPFPVDVRVASIARNAVITLAEADLISENDAIAVIVELDGEWEDLAQLQAVYAAVRREH